LTTSLFVYGTLMAQHAQNGLLNHVERQVAWVEGLLYDLPAGYPALVLAPPTPGVERPRVWGELAGPFPEDLLRLLDVYEGVGEGLYDRVRVDVKVGLRSYATWVYVMDAARARRGRLVRSGRWRPARRR
jgi:gamma-glutamylcyclotransferase (GGCT)/AIG2-like uncharacterized protein YtfP